MDIRPPAYRQHHPPLDSFRVWSENQSYGCSLPTSPSSINFWREPLHAPRHSEYQGGASGRYPLISPIGISVLQSFGLQLPFDFVRKLFTYERVARLSFPYPSSRLMTPQIPRPAPRAMTKVCKTSTALLKKSIFYVPESFFYGFYDGNRKAGMSWPPCAAVDSGFSFQIFGCAFLRLCVSRVSAALSASSFTEWVSDLYIKIRQIRRILNLRPRPRQKPQIPPPASA